MQEKIKIWLSWLLLASIFLSVLLVALGALLYLLQEGQMPVSYSQFSQATSYKSYLPILQGALGLDPASLILSGFLILVFSQVFRVGALGFFFFQSAEYLLALSSFFIFIVLIYSMLWHE